MRGNLKTARIAKKFSQKSLANQLGVSERLIQHMEAGTRKGSVDIWIELSSLLEQPIAYLYLDDESILHEQNGVK